MKEIRERALTVLKAVESAKWKIPHRINLIECLEVFGYSKGYLVRMPIVDKPSFEELLENLKAWLEVLNNRGIELYVRVTYVINASSYFVVLSREPEEYKLYIDLSDLSLWMPINTKNKKLFWTFLRYACYYLGYKLGKQERVMKWEKFKKTKQTELTVLLK